MHGDEPEWPALALEKGELVKVGNLLKIYKCLPTGRGDHGATIPPKQIGKVLVIRSEEFLHSKPMSVIRFRLIAPKEFGIDKQDDLSFIRQINEVAIQITDGFYAYWVCLAHPKSYSFFMTLIEFQPDCKRAR